MCTECHHNALVILTTSPTGRAVVAVEMSGASAKVLSRSCVGNTQGLLCICKKGRGMKRQQAAGFTNKQSQQCAPFRADLLDQKSVSAILRECRG